MRIRTGLRLGYWFSTGLDFYEAQPLWRRRQLEKEMDEFIREHNANVPSPRRGQR